MIYDVGAPPWWKRTIPYKNGEPARVYYNHRVRGWKLVRDPFSTWKYYWADLSTRRWRATPPPFDKEVECQTNLNGADFKVAEDFFTLHRKETECQTESPDHKEAECQTIGLFTSDPPADTSVWVALGSSVAGLPQEQQTMIYSRLVRFLELGLLDLRSHSL